MNPNSKARRKKKKLGSIEIRETVVVADTSSTAGSNTSTPTYTDTSTPSPSPHNATNTQTTLQPSTIPQVHEYHHLYPSINIISPTTSPSPNSDTEKNHKKFDYTIPLPETISIISTSQIIPTITTPTSTQTLTYTTINTTTTTTITHSTPLVSTSISSTPKMDRTLATPDFQPILPTDFQNISKYIDVDSDMDIDNFHTEYINTHNSSIKESLKKPEKIKIQSNIELKSQIKTTKENKNKEDNKKSTGAIPKAKTTKEQEKITKKRKLNLSPPNTTDLDAITIDNTDKPTQNTNNRPQTRQQNSYPPIHIYTQKHNDAIKDITNKINPTPLFKFNNSALVCHAKSEQTHKELIDHLKLNNYEYYTHNIEKHRPTKVVVKYIPIDVQTEDIEQELRHRQLPILHISRIMFTRNGKREPSNILILTIPKEATHSYYEVTDLCHLKVNITDYVRMDIPQCHRCQKFGHSSVLCNRAHKCVRCGCSHGGVLCQAEGCKCANCGAAHPANYRGCPAYLAAKARSQPVPPSTSNPRQETNTNTNKQTKNPNTVPTQPQPTRTAEEQRQNNIENWKKFRQNDTQQAKNTQNIPETKQNTNTDNDEQDNPIRELFNFIKGFNVTKIWNTIKETINKIKNAEDITEKILVIFEALSNLF